MGKRRNRITIVVRGTRIIRILCKPEEHDDNTRGQKPYPLFFFLFQSQSRDRVVFKFYLIAKEYYNDANFSYVWVKALIIGTMSDRSVQSDSVSKFHCSNNLIIRKENHFWDNWFYVVLKNFLHANSGWYSSIYV